MSARTAIERNFGTMAYEIAELRRRIENGRRPGAVSRVHPDDPRRVKVDIGPEGTVVETPWIRFPERAGAIRTYGRPSVGEQVFVNSFHGEIGINSWLSEGGFTDDNPAPHDKDGELMTAIGGMRFLMTADGVTLLGDLTVTGDVKVTGDTLLDGGVDLGGENGEPAGLKGSIDDHGHALVTQLSSKVRIVL